MDGPIKYSIWERIGEPSNNLSEVTSGAKFYRNFRDCLAHRTLYWRQRTVNIFAKTRDTAGHLETWLPQRERLIEFGYNIPAHCKQPRSKFSSTHVRRCQRSSGIHMVMNARLGRSYHSRLTAGVSKARQVRARTASELLLSQDSGRFWT
jgi:hypothetical protein